MLDFLLISKGFRMRSNSEIFRESLAKLLSLALSLALLHVPLLSAQSVSRKLPANSARPKLVVVLVVDQMRGDYVDKFQSQWTGGLHRLVTEGAWFHEAAYPYAATETCVGHSTISTGAFPRQSRNGRQRMVGPRKTGTSDLHRRHFRKKYSLSFRHAF